MNRHFLHRHGHAALLGLGWLALLWVAAGFVTHNPLALGVTALIALVFQVGALELWRWRQDTQNLQAALDQAPDAPESVVAWLDQLPATLRQPVRQRLEGERLTLPCPALTPYLVGLLVMLGMLGTFLGMVVTLNGAVFALDATTDLKAIRSAFATPIRGLGLAFGTSVAGVATSAVLGLMSALSRRERQQVVQRLDQRIATVWSGLSLTGQRQAAYRALQQQSEQWPALLGQMQSMMAQLQASQQQLNAGMLAQQDAFHAHTQQAYTTLAQQVEQSLQGSLDRHLQATAQALGPMVNAALQDLAQTATAVHERLAQTTESQLTQWGSTFANATRQVSDTWTHGLAQQTQQHERLGHAMERAALAGSERFEQRAQALADRLEDRYQALQAAHAEQDRAQLQAWTDHLQAMVSQQSERWAQLQDTAQQQHLGTAETLQQTALRITEQLHTHAQDSLTRLDQLRGEHEALAQNRQAHEARWQQHQQAQLQALTEVLREELSSLREEEAQRGAAAVQRLGELEAAVASHLAQLGQALEAPIARLVDSTAQVPAAAAEVLVQLRQELSNSLERDQALLEERSRTMASLNGLLDTLEHTSREQRKVIDTLVASSATALQNASEHFAQRVQTESEQWTRLAAQFAHSGADLTSSAVEVASLGEALGGAVRSFSEANQQLVAHLTRIEQALERSMTRSDDQLAYYVAQAREIIDLSAMTQKQMVDGLRELRTV